MMYLEFITTFDTIFHSIFLEKLDSYSLYWVKKKKVMWGGPETEGE